MNCTDQIKQSSPSSLFSLFQIHDKVIYMLKLSDRAHYQVHRAQSSLTLTNLRTAMSKSHPLAKIPKHPVAHKDFAKVSKRNGFRGASGIQAPLIPLKEGENKSSLVSGIQVTKFKKAPLTFAGRSHDSILFEPLFLSSRPPVVVKLLRCLLGHTVLLNLELGLFGSVSIIKLLARSAALLEVLPEPFFDEPH